MRLFLVLIIVIGIQISGYSQTVVQFPHFLIGADSLLSGLAYKNTFFAYDEIKGGVSIGTRHDIMWHKDSIGSGSIAVGFNAIASGPDGIALGYNTHAQGKFAVALGKNTWASGDDGAVAIGEESIARGDHGAIALGYESEARGDYGAIAMGYSTLASGYTGATAGGVSTRATGDDGATAFGAYTKANGNEGSIAMGHESEANGNAGTMALGNYTIANGNLGAFAIGNFTISNGNSCTVVGMFNKELVDSAKIVDNSSPMFVIGNGWADVFRSNALVVRKDGKMGVGRNPLSNLLEVEGAASKTTAGNWLANSDRRIKTDIKDIQDSYQKILQLRPVMFKYTNEWRTKHPEIQDKYYYNFIAQEYGEVFPNAIQGSGEFLKEGSEEVLQIDTYNAQIVHLAATRELIHDMEHLKRENELLKKQLTDIESRLSQIAYHIPPVKVDP